mmetsp:Transcript_92381/g.270432  ORF Transcript_92381/g.270432 Transcript_92381/m.270432 type:complete len:414 (-) Transcript_92381:331-1572(-)
MQPYTEHQQKQPEIQVQPLTLPKGKPQDWLPLELQLQSQEKSRMHRLQPQLDLQEPQLQPQEQPAQQRLTDQAGTHAQVEPQLEQQPWARCQPNTQDQVEPRVPLQQEPQWHSQALGLEPQVQMQLGEKLLQGRLECHSVAATASSPAASVAESAFSETSSLDEESVTGKPTPKHADEPASSEPLSVLQCCAPKEVKVMVSPGDDSWEGRVLVTVPADATVGAVKAAVAVCVGRPDIRRHGRLAAPARGRARPGVLGDAEPLAGRRELRLLDADGLQWPPRPARVKVKSASLALEFVLSVRAGAAMAEVRQLLAAHLRRPEVMRQARLGRHLPDGCTFAEFPDDEPLGTRRTLLVEGLQALFPEPGGQRLRLPPEPLRYPPRGQTPGVVPHPTWSARWMTSGCPELSEQEGPV